MSDGTKVSVSVGMISVMKQAAADLPGTLARIKGLGFDAVEPVRRTGTPPEVFEHFRRLFGDRVDSTFADPDIKTLRAALDDNGLAVSASHIWLAEGAGLEEVFDEQELLGNTMLVVAGIVNPNRGGTGFEDFSSMDDIKRIAERVNLAAEKASARGMRLGYHNHSDDVRSDLDGRSGLEVFFDHLESEVFAEIDVYWAYAGGRHPAELIERLGSRVQLVHLKDGTGVAGDPNTAVGSGSIDIPAVLAAARHVRSHTVEFDSTPDIWSALEQSHEFIVRHRPSAK